MEFYTDHYKDLSHLFFFSERFSSTGGESLRKNSLDSARRLAIAEDSALCTTESARKDKKAK